MVLNILKTIFNLIWGFVKIPVIALLIFIAVMIILCFAHILYLRIFKGMKPKTGEHYKVKEPNIFKKIFYLAPRQFAKDRLERDPEFFRHQGLIIYTGNQGSGKTSTMVHDIINMQKEYPKCKCITNFGFKNEDKQMYSWKQMLDFNNGMQGVIVALDEIQNWFNSKQSKDFPPEMLQTVTTNRKNRRVIMGTAQRFYMVAKDIRTQCSEVRHCITLGGVFTIVIRKSPIINSEGEVEKEKFKGMYCWVHSPEVRDAYDTYRMIEVLSKTGFKPTNEQYRFEKPKEEINVVIDKKALKKK